MGAFPIILLGLMAWSVPGARGEETPAAFLRQDARAAERKKDWVRAYLLYSQAAAADPEDRASWARSLALRRRALEAAKLFPAGPLPGPEPDGEAVEDADVREAREMRAPPRLAPSPAEGGLRLRGESRVVIEQALKAFGIEVIFDGEFQSRPDTRFEMASAPFAEILEALLAATGTIVVAVSERVALVARDTPQKRQELEHTLAVAVPLPHPLTTQEAQELARSVQQLLEIQKLQIDSTRRIVVVRDRASKVIPAVALLEQFLRHRTEVVVEIEFLEATEKSMLDIGMQLPGRFPLAWLSSIWNSKPAFPGGVSNFLTFGRGSLFFGLGLVDSRLFGTMAESTGRSLSRAELRSVEGQAVQFHLGDRYPVLTAGYFGATDTTGQAFTPPPTFNFEDLGVALKVTPKVHDREEITLEIEADYKVLTGQTLNGIPVIANRKFTGTSRMRMGETAVVMGLALTSEVRTLTGIAGLAQLPFVGAAFRQDSRERETSQALLAIRPRILSVPPAELGSRLIRTGTETRPRM